MRNVKAGNTQRGWGQGNQNFNLIQKNNLFLIAFSNKAIPKIFHTIGSVKTISHS